MKKFLSGILAAMLTVSCFNGIVIAQEEKSGFVVYNDFETEESEFGFTSVSGSLDNYKYVKDDAEHGTVLRVKTPPTHSMYSELPEPVSDGGFLVSFDIKMETKDDYIFLRYYSGSQKKASALSHNDSFLTWGAKNGGFDYFPQMDIKGNWQCSDDPVKYEVGKWHHIDIFADFYTRKVYYYADNVLYMADNMRSDFEVINGVFITPYDIGKGERTFCLDNWACMKTDYENIKPLLDAGHNAPDRIKSKVKMSLTDEAFGRNYFDASRMQFNLNMNNTSAEDVDGEAIYRITDDAGQIIWSKTENVKLGKGEEKLQTVVANPNSYGIFNFSVELKDKEKGDISYFNADFALMRESGPNEEMYTCIQFLQDRVYTPNIEDFLEIYERTGFAGVRTTIAWDIFEDNPKEFKVSESAEPWVSTELNVLRLSPLETMRTLKSGHWRYTDGSNRNMPQTEEELKAWYDYCYNMVLQTKDHTQYYEVWNEPNLIPNFNPQGVPPEGYVKFLKVAYEAVKAVDPSLVVIGCSQSNYGTQFVGAVLDAGGGEYMDAISFHPYMWTQGPEAGQMGYIKTLRDFVDAKGYSHLKFYVTEIGWQAYSVGDFNQAIYTTQMCILNKVNGQLMDKMWIFRAVEDDVPDGEGFGYIENQLVESPFMARRGLVALANYNRLMTDAKFVRSQVSSEGMPVYQFKLKDGRDCIITWNSAGDKRDLALDLGANSVVVSDIYGTENTYKSVDGKFNFSIDEYIYYIIGNFTKSEEISSMFTVDKDEFEIVGGSRAEFIVENRAGNDFELIATPSKNLTIDSIIPLGNGKTKVVVKADTAFDTEESVLVTIKKNGSTYYTKVVDANCLEAISAKAGVEHHVGNRWRFNVDVSNHNYDGAVGGKVIIESPVTFSKWVPFRLVSPVKGGTTTTVKIPIPDFIGTTDVDLVGKLVMDDGTEIDLSRLLTFKGMPFMKNEPTFDGVLSPGEWPTSYALEFGDGKPGIDFVQGTYSGKDDHSGKIYCAWDRKNFYLAADVTDDSFELDSTNIWASDSIQFAFSLEKTKDAKRTEITMGIDPKTLVPTIQRNSSLAPPSDGSRFIHEVNIVNYPEDHKTIYELSIPWSEMFPAGFNIADHSQVLFSIMVNDRDNNTRELWHEIGSGIGRTKTALYHLEYNLMK